MIKWVMDYMVRSLLLGRLACVILSGVRGSCMCNSKERHTSMFNPIRHSRMFLAGVWLRLLDSGYKPAGMTLVGAAGMTLVEAARMTLVGAAGMTISVLRVQ